MQWKGENAPTLSQLSAAHFLQEGRCPVHSSLTMCCHHSTKSIHTPNLKERKEIEFPPVYTHVCLGQTYLFKHEQIEAGIQISNKSKSLSQKFKINYYISAELRYRQDPTEKRGRVARSKGETISVKSVSSSSRTQCTYPEKSAFT